MWMLPWPHLIWIANGINLNGCPQSLPFGQNSGYRNAKYF